MTTDRKILDDHYFDTLFREARSHRAWEKHDVSDVILQAAYDLAKMGPTANNGSPMRVIFVKSPQAKEKLKPCLDAGNVEKMMTAPVTAIIAHDVKFYEKLDVLAPHVNAASFADNPERTREIAFRNGTLQGAYLMLAARSLGLDCGPMSGFDAARVQAAFFADRPDLEVNFLCNMGYGDQTQLKPRGPRLSFDEVCDIV